HHNTLHAFAHRRFHDALREASALFGAAGYLGLEAYRALYAEGRITDADLDAVLDEQRDALIAAPRRAGPFDSRMIARLSLTHDLEAQSEAGLRFLLTERGE